MADHMPEIFAQDSEMGAASDPGRPETHSRATAVGGFEGAGSLRPLSSLKRGQTAVVCLKAVGPQDRDLLRAMGVRANCSLRLCRAGEPCIIALLEGEDRACSCRIGLARELADRIFVSLTTDRA